MPDLGRFYHLHPEQNGADTFAERLPSMFAGNYALFADVVRKHATPWAARLGRSGRSGLGAKLSSSAFSVLRATSG